MWEGELAVEYAFFGLSLFCLFGLAYSWVWWIRNGQHQPNKRAGSALTALVYNTLLPSRLMRSVQMCCIPRSTYALNYFPFAALGLGLALLVQGKLRWLLATTALGLYLGFVAANPIAPSTGKFGSDQAAIEHIGGGSGVSEKWKGQPSVVEQARRGMRAVSILSDITVALGDRVDVLVVGKEQETNIAVENVEVVAVGKRVGLAHRPEAKKETGVVTILVSADEAKRLWDANFRLRLRKAD